MINESHNACGSGYLIKVKISRLFFVCYVSYLLCFHVQLKYRFLLSHLKKFIFTHNCCWKFVEEPCTSGTTPVISHCPTIVGEGSGAGVAVMRGMHKSNSEESTSSEETVTVHACH